LAVTKEGCPKFLDELEVGLPLIVMSALCHLIDTLPFRSDGRITVLDAGGKYEIRVTWGSLHDLLLVTKSNIHAQ
jgi:hypothetical protein